MLSLYATSSISFFFTDFICLPKPVKLNLNENEGYFEYMISGDSKMVQMRSRLVINKTNFDKSDYQTLIDFYALVVKKHAEQIVFKKIK